MKKIYVSDLICVNDSIEETRNFFEKNNIKRVEFFIENQDIEHSKKLEFILKSLKTESISFHASYRYFRLTCSDEKWDLMENDFKKSIEICKEHNGEFLVLHTNEGLPGEVMDKGILEKRIQKLIKLGKEKEVKVVIENVGIGKNILYNQEEYIELIKKYNFDSLIDIGHAIANNWDLDKVITELKENIIAYHFHNNDGEKDLHKSIYDGKSDYERIISLVKENAPEANIVLEYSAATPKREILETLEKLS